MAWGAFAWLDGGNWFSQEGGAASGQSSQTCAGDAIQAQDIDAVAASGQGGQSASAVGRPEYVAAGAASQAGQSSLVAAELEILCAGSTGQAGQSQASAGLLKPQVRFAVSGAYTTYVCSAGDTLDYVCWKNYGAAFGYVELVLQSNIGVGDYGTQLPVGLEIALPVVEIERQEQNEIVLW